MRKVFLVGLSIAILPLAYAQSKRELVCKVLSTAKDYQGISSVLGIIQSMPQEYAYLPHLDPLGNQGYRISSSFGERIDPLTGERRYHKGIDLASSYACKVYASASGKVVFSGVRGGYGKCIIIEHRYGFSSYYAHMTYLHVSSGMHVHAGDVIGFVGSTGRSTGNHLHYEVRKHSRCIDPISWIGLSPKAR